MSDAGDTSFLRKHSDTPNAACSPHSTQNTTLYIAIQALQVFEIKDLLPLIASQFA